MGQEGQAPMVATASSTVFFGLGSKVVVIRDLRCAAVEVLFDIAVEARRNANMEANGFKGPPTSTAFDCSRSSLG
jgi:hypothetical protein